MFCLNNGFNVCLEGLFIYKTSIETTSQGKFFIFEVFPASRGSFLERSLKRFFPKNLLRQKLALKVNFDFLRLNLFYECFWAWRKEP